MRWSSGDYQIAPIAARSTAMGRWRLTPPWYWGDTACGRGIGSFAPPGASSFLSSLKESYQRKPLETTFQDFLGAGTAGANLTVCTRGRGAAVITVGQKDCACVHRRGGFRDRLPSHGRGICFYRVGDYQIAPLPPCGGKGRCARRARIYLFLSLRHGRTNSFYHSNRQRQRKAVLVQSGDRQRSGKRRLREGKRGRQRTGVAR